jgi:hypothetical protein
MASAQQGTDKTAKEVQVAKISSRQAIIVTLITSLAGLIGGIIGMGIKQTSSQANPPTSIHQISIEGVEFSDCNDRCSVRIVVEVNGQTYSYPSRAIWGGIGPRMSKERFPLVPSPEFKVNIKAFLRYPDNQVEELQSQVLTTDKTDALPADREYALYPYQGFRRAAAPVLTVHYRIE